MKAIFCFSYLTSGGKMCLQGRRRTETMIHFSTTAKILLCIVDMDLFHPHGRKILPHLIDMFLAYQGELRSSVEGNNCLANRIYLAVNR